MSASHQHPFRDLGKLVEIGGIIRRTRNEIITKHYDSKKDRWGWGLACWIFERICMAIYDLAVVDSRMMMVSPTLHFVWTVDGIPLRMYRGKRDRKAPGSQLNMHSSEIHARNATLFPDLQDNEVSAYRIMYETDRSTLLVSSVFLVALNEEGEVVEAWLIPPDGSQATGDNEIPATPIAGADKPLTLEPVELRLIEEIIEEEQQQLEMEEKAREGAV